MNMDNENVKIPEYIRQAAYEAQLLVAYVARYSPVNIDSETTEILINSRYMIENNSWNAEYELKFWNAYDKMATHIEPVTIESLKATMPDPFADKSDKKNMRTEASKKISKYKMFAAFSLIFLIAAQIYWMNGSDLASKIQTLFKQIDEIGFNIAQRKELKEYKDIDKDIEINKLETEKKELIQEFGASYQLLQNWNRIWQILMLKEQFKAGVTYYVQQKYEEETGDIERQIKGLENVLEKGELKAYERNEFTSQIKALELEKKRRKFEYEFDKERNKLFLTRISAEFMIRSLQIYILPLLYGLLGAIIFTLRNLALEVKTLTYTNHSEMKYRLRISMGLLGGMAIGWFLKPDELSVGGSFSPMALAFLTGYNVELLFTIMDKFVEAISKFAPGENKEAKE